jgi:hypothetical protein
MSFPGASTPGLLVISSGSHRHRQVPRQRPVRGEARTPWVLSLGRSQRRAFRRRAWVRRRRSARMQPRARQTLARHRVTRTRTHMVARRRCRRVRSMHWLRCSRPCAAEHWLASSMSYSFAVHHSPLTVLTVVVHLVQPFILAGLGGHSAYVHHSATACSPCSNPPF